MLSNSVTLIGNLGSDINMRQTTASQTLGNVNIAVSRVYTDRNGDTVKDTQWFRLVAWGKVAERMSAQLEKGEKVLVEGRLTCRSYETKDGQKRESVEINVSSFQKLASKVSTSAPKTTIESGKELVAEPSF